MILELIFAGLGMAAAAFLSRDASGKVADIVKEKGIFSKKKK
jgi:hypothetical protein